MYNQILKKFCLIRPHLPCDANITVFKIRKIGIFGSYATDRANEDSNVDILVEFSEPVRWEFIDLHDYLEQILDKKVDLATVSALKDSILNEVIYTRCSSFSAACLF